LTCCRHAASRDSSSKSFYLFSTLSPVTAPTKGLLFSPSPTFVGIPLLGYSSGCYLRFRHSIGKLLVERVLLLNLSHSTPSSVPTLSLPNCRTLPQTLPRFLASLTEFLSPQPLPGPATGRTLVKSLPIAVSSRWFSFGSSLVQATPAYSKSNPTTASPVLLYGEPGPQCPRFLWQIGNEFQLQTPTYNGRHESPAECTCGAQ
jgi:hypothetical protein